MSSWETWEISAEWCSECVCPDCGHSLIITYPLETCNLYNGICLDCRKQYTIRSNTTLTVNVIALEQQDRIDALESRVARLEALVQKLLDTHVTRRPETDANTPDEPQQTDDIRERYKFLF